MKAGGRPYALGGEQVEGHHAVHELLVAGRRQARRLWVAEAEPLSEPVERLAQLAADQGVPVHIRPAEVVLATARTGAPQGVIAWADPVVAVMLEELLDISATRRPALSAGAGRRHGSGQLRFTAAHGRVRRRRRRGCEPPSFGAPDPGRSKSGGRRCRNTCQSPQLVACRPPCSASTAPGSGWWASTRSAKTSSGRQRCSTGRWHWSSGPKGRAFPAWRASGATRSSVYPSAALWDRSTLPRPPRWPVSRWPAGERVALAAGLGQRPAPLRGPLLAYRPARFFTGGAPLPPVPGTPLLRPWGRGIGTEKPPKPRRSAGQ